ncbi:MAG: PQQ-binding-like beta-propeller repeat protein [Planctomycetota bacterium]
MKHWMQYLALVSLTVLLSLVSVEAGSVDGLAWPQWRGPKRDSTVQGPVWPAKISGDHLRQAWRVDLGPGYPGPIVTSDRVFVAATEDKSREVVLALDRKTGKEVWRTQWDGAMKVPFIAAANGSWIRSTPVYDGENLYVGGMRDVLVCLNAETGKEKWRIDFVKKFSTPLPDFGFVSSPMVLGDYLYVQAGASFFKLKKETGEEVWRILRDEGGMYGGVFSSPTVATVAGREQLLFQTRTTLAGVDTESGKVLWTQEVPAFRGMNILTPTAIGDAIFTSTYGGRTFLFGVDRKDDQFQARELWTNKAQGYMSSPVVIDGFIYVHLRNKRVACFDLATGKERWISDKRFGQYWSMVAQGNRILALDEDGTLYLLKANPDKFELLDSRKISDQPTWGHLAVSGHQIFIRELNAIAAYDWLDGK